MDSIPRLAKKSSSESSAGDTAPLNEDSDRGGGETLFDVGESSSQPSPKMSSRSSFASQASPASKEDARGAGAGAAGLGFAAGRRAAGRAAEAPREPVPVFCCVVCVDGGGGPVDGTSLLPNLSVLSRWW